MKIRRVTNSDRMMPRAQTNWDWRAAANFVFGGSGGGLLFFAALATLAGAGFIAPGVIGLALIATGLTCVWFEIGRPFRALNVYLHPSSSWMTREATVATVLFACGFASLWFQATALILLTGLLGLAFVYSQARILSTNKGIPAWRHRRCLPLVVSTGLTEGAGLLAVLLLWQSGVPIVPFALLLLALVVVRYLAWCAYLDGLSSDGAPAGSLAVLGAMRDRFLLFGHAAPALLIAIGLTGFASLAWAAAFAGVAVVATGWQLKYTLVRRAAFNQGLSLQHLPVRGAGAPGPALKPGWPGTPGQKV